MCLGFLEPSLPCRLLYLLLLCIFSLVNSCWSSGNSSKKVLGLPSLVLGALLCECPTSALPTLLSLLDCWIWRAHASVLPCVPVSVPRSMLSTAAPPYTQQLTKGTVLDFGRN